MGVTLRPKRKVVRKSVVINVVPLTNVSSSRFGGSKLSLAKKKKTYKVNLSMVARIF